MLTLQDIQKKYGTNLTWENGQASGTCLCTSHSRVAVEAIKSGIASGRGRVPVFGPVIMCLPGHAKKSAAEIRLYPAIAKKAGIGRYFGGKWASNFSHTWEEALSSAMFKCQFSLWPDSYFSLDGLNFASLESFVEFMDNFTTNGLYDYSIQLTCYFLEDQSIPKIGQVRAFNSFYGALTDNGGGVVDVTALRNPMEPLLLDTFLREAFLEHHGIVLPPAMSFEDVASLFWMPRAKNKKSMYNQNLNGDFNTPMAERQMWDSVNNVCVPQNLSNQGNSSMSTLRNWKLNWVAKTITKMNSPVRTEISAGAPASPITSLVMSVPVVDRATGDLKAVHLAPYGIDTLNIGWENGDIYGLHFVTETNVGEGSAFRIQDLGNSESNQSQAYGRRFTKRDWLTRANFHDGAGNSVGDIRARLFRKGSPFVGSSSNWAIKDMKKLGMRFIGCVVE